jgi:hypothetical protein
VASLWGRVGPSATSSIGGLLGRGTAKMGGIELESRAMASVVQKGITNVSSHQAQSAFSQTVHSQSTALGFKGMRGFELKTFPNTELARNSPTVIEDLSYCDHAIVQMQNRGIMPSVVKNTVQNGNSYPSLSRPSRTVYYDKINDVSAILEKDGTVRQRMGFRNREGIWA